MFFVKIKVLIVLFTSFMIKNIVRNLLRKVGRKIVLIDAHEDNLNLVKDNWLKNKNIDIVFDIGASDGGFSKKIRKLFPSAKIYSFEALPDIFQNLTNNFIDDELHFSYNIALNNYNGKTTFYRCESTGSSSILEMSNLHKEAYPHTKKNTAITLNCFRLDDFIKEKKICLDNNVLIKIDVQGAEKLVFEGATDLLKKAQLIFTEINFNSVYKENVLFNDLSNFLSNKGFKVEGVENVSQSIVDGTFLQADAYFSK